LTFVIDASIIVGLAFGETPNLKVAATVDALAVSEALTPSLFFFEVRNALVVNERRGRATPEGSADFLRRLARLPIRVAPTPEDDASLLSLARKRKLTVYEAAYLELARREGLPLATVDRALEKAALAEGVALFGA
jgi:predicted nucleic acid-binding protein